MTAHPAEPGTDGELIGRCYTKARRAPLVHGVIRDVNGGRGIRIPGGPYTMTQLAAIVATFVVLILTRPVWGGHGLVDVVLLLGLPFAAAFVLRHLHIDGRNPAAALLSVVTMLTGPRWGRLHGRPHRSVRPASGDTRITLASQDSPIGELAPALPGSPIGELPDSRTRSTPPPAKTARLARAHPSSPIGESAPVSGQAVASGVQALLARRAAGERTDPKD